MFVCPECGEAFRETGFCTRDGTRLGDAAGDPMIGSTIGQFRVAALIGVGGMGRIYKGVNPTIASRVAIKVLAHDGSAQPDLVDRFFAEARAVNLIRHENIVNVLDLSQLPDRRPYIVMEYLDGVPLAQMIDSRGPLPLGTLARIASEVLSALGAAHAKGIVHRDLKPDNIFITPQGRAKVLDFGIAKLMPELTGSPGPTRQGSILGTPNYMSPEQCLSQPVDPRTDIYSLGVILFECATGRRPFEAHSLFDLLQMQIQVAPPPPRSFRPDLPADYEAVMLRALAKSPADRWQSATELAAALAHVSGSLPAEAWAPIGDAERAGGVSIPTPRTPAQIAYTPPGAAAPAPPAPPVPFQSQQPTPTAAGQIATEVVKRPRSRLGPVIAVVGVVAAAAIGIAVWRSQAASPPTAAKQTGAGGGETPARTQVKKADTPAKTDTPAKADTPAAKAEAEPEDGDAEAGHTEPTTLESGSTIEAGKGITIKGPVKIVRSDRSEAPNPNPKAWDVSGYVPTAAARAREAFSDAVLVRIDAEGVHPSGKADLTLDDSFYVLYRFLSPSRSMRPKDLPKGVDFKSGCLFYVYVSAESVSSYVVDNMGCDDLPLAAAAPRCNAAQVWKRAIKGGAPSANAVGSIGLWADDQFGTRWLFHIDTEHTQFFPDDC